MKNCTARAQIYVFLIITFSISAAFQFKIIFDGGLDTNQNLILPLMWTPGIVGLLCSLLFGHRWHDIGFRYCSWKQICLAYALPACTAILILVLLLLFGIDSFGMREKYIEKFGSETGVLKAMLIIAPTAAVFLASLRALGEEIGWRGFMHARLREAQIKNPNVVTGIIWSIWHIPLIIFADYSTSDKPLLNAGLFVFGAISISIFMGWQRQITNSIWPAAILHGSHNTWIQKIYPVFVKKGPLHSYFGSESGLFLVLIYLSVAVFIYQKKGAST
jgi:membrane protease YdiL (CAAX protease family)